MLSFVVELLLTQQFRSKQKFLQEMAIFCKPKKGFHFFHIFHHYIPLRLYRCTVRWACRHIFIPDTNTNTSFTMNVNIINIDQCEVTSIYYTLLTDEDSELGFSVILNWLNTYEILHPALQYLFSIIKHILNFTHVSLFYSYYICALKMLPSSLK